MGAGGSIPKSKNELICSREVKSNVVRILSTTNVSVGKYLPKEVGLVIPLEKSLSTSYFEPPEVQNKGVQYGWFVERLQHSDQWENYNDESSSRLEAAFLARENTCLVVHKSRTYTVDLMQMVQLTSGVSTCSAGDDSQALHRKVRRAPCEPVSDPASGGGGTKRMIQGAGAFLEDDPFFNEGNDDGKGGTENEGLSLGSVQKEEYSATEAQKNTPNENKELPILMQTIKPNEKGSAFAMAVSPSSLQDSSIYSGSNANTKGLMVVTGGRKGFLRSWDASTAEWTCEYDLQSQANIIHVTYSPSGEYIAAGTDNFKAYVLKDGISSPQHELHGHTGKVYGLSFMCTGSKLVTSSMDSTVRIWDMETGACTQHQSVQESYVFFIRCSENQPHFAISGGNDYLVTLHDFRTPTTVAMRCAGHESTLWYGALQPQSNYNFATCGKDCTVRIWDARKGSQALFVLRNHRRPVHCVEYSPSGSYILSSARDARVIGAVSSTGESRWMAKASTSTIFRVFYSEKEKKILSCDTNVVGIWDWNPSAMEE